MKQASHTTSTTTRSLRILPEIGLVDVADPSLSERQAGRVSEQLEVFADRMREGLLAASVAIGLDVMGELVDAEVTSHLSFGFGPHYCLGAALARVQLQEGIAALARRFTCPEIVDIVESRGGGLVGPSSLTLSFSRRDERATQD